MDIRGEISQSKDRSLLESDQTKLLNVDSGKMLNPTPLARYNPFDIKAQKIAKKAQQKASVVQEKPSVQEKASVVQDDSSSIISAVVADLVNDNVPSVDGGKVNEKEKDTETETEKKLSSVVQDKEIHKEKESEKEKEKENEMDNVPVVIYKSKRKGSGVSKDKPKEKGPDVVIEKEKPQDKKPKEKGPSDSHDKRKDKPQDKKLNLKVNLKVKPQDKPQDNPVLSLKKPAEEQVKPKRKMDPVNVDENKKKLKLKQQKDAEEKKISKSIVALKRKKVDSSGSDEDEDEDKGKRKIKGKGPQKKKKDDSVKEEDILPDAVMNQIMKRLLKNTLVKEETDEENETKPNKKGKKKEKVLTEDEIRHQEYLGKFPILQARSAPTALHTAIHGIKNVDIEKFLVEIGFSSYIKFDINKIPSRLGRYVVQNFDAETCRLKLEGDKYIEATVSKVHELLGIPIGGESLLSLETRAVDDDFENVWVGQFEGKSAKQIRVNDIASKLIEAKEVDFLFKVNFLTLFTNTMGMVAGLQGEINFDVVKHLHEDTDIRSIDWCEYIFHCLKLSRKPTTLQNKYTGPYTLLALLYLDSTKYKKLTYVRTRPAIKQWSSFLMSKREDMELKEEVMGTLEVYDESELPETEGFVAGCSSNTSYKEELLNNLEQKLTNLSNERNCFEDLLAVAGLEFAGDSKLNELHKKYVQIFKHPVSLTGEDLDADDGNGDGDDVDKRLAVVDAVPEEQDLPGSQEYEENLSTPENLSQWFEQHADLVEGVMELVEEEHEYNESVRKGVPFTFKKPNIAGLLTPEKMGTRASHESPINEKRLVKPSSYLCSPYMNKKTKVVPKISKLEFILGNSLFAMQGETIEKVFETTSGISIYSIRLNMETLAPGLDVDANVIDCWAAILNYEESHREVGSPARHFFPTGCITSAMFDGTLKSFKEKFEEFEKEVSAQLQDDVSSLALNGIDLAFFPIRKAAHFYVVVFSLSNKAAVTILDNSNCGATYAEKYKDTVELLQKLFAKHLKLYGHIKHASIAKAKPKIANFKWRTKNNFRDCGIFAMLHMESYTGQAIAKWDCGLVAESRAQLDMLRQLRFKFATKILLHEVNQHAQKMFELAQEFDKLPPEEKMTIILEAVKNREERERK